jgi:phage repressor protein C with HTH and peptisase S24 domain
MRMRTGIIIGAIIIIVASASLAFLMPQKSNAEVTPVNQTVQSAAELNIVNITVKTDGHSVSINTANVSGSGQIQDAMIKEMKQKAGADVLSDKSTVNSLKADIKAIAQKYNYTAEVTLTSQFGNDKLPFPATVSGTSMLPTLNDGQNVMALKTTSFKVGDIVIARHSTYGLIIKRVASISDGKVFLKSDNRNVEIINHEKTLPDGVVEIETTEKTPLDTWQPKKNIIAVVKTY